jgi:hypothetical protein
MDARKYSVEEIDRMRAAIIAPYHHLPAVEFIGFAVVEDRLRTFMLNGTEPEELEQSYQGVKRSVGTDRA